MSTRTPPPKGPQHPTEGCTFAEAERLLDEFIGAADPADPKDRKKIRIVQAATKLFIRHGYRRTSVDEIARAAGVAKGTVYLYFKTKADLLLHAIAEEKRQYITRVRYLFEGEMEPRRRLREYLREVLLLAPEMLLVSRLLGRDHELLVVLDELDPAFREWMHKTQVSFLAAFFHSVAPERASEAEIHDRAAVLLTLLHGALMVTDESIRGGMPLKRFAEVFADMLVDGLAPAVPQRPEEA